MTKSELIERVRSRYPNLTNEEIKRIIDTIFEQLLSTLSEEGRIEIRGFGSFSVRERASMKARNPKTNEPIQIGKRKVVYFRMGKEFRDSLNKDE